MTKPHAKRVVPESTAVPARCCAKRRRVRGWPLLLLPLAGLASLIWFLVRVIPKPSRAMYPCQRVAFPLASSFVIWLTGLVGSVFAFGKAKRLLRQSRPVVAGLCLAAALLAGVIALVTTPETDLTAAEPKANAPIGKAKGVYPGRVVWVHDPDATDWDGPGNGHWWQDEHTNQKACDRMMSRAIRELTGQPSDKAAWDALFRYHNRTRGKGNVGYKRGQKIAIKVNFVGMIFSARGVNADTYELESWRDYMNTSPQMILALMDQLVNTVGVSQRDLSVCDTLAYLANEYYEILHRRFPNVRYVDRGGKFGRVQCELSNIPLYWSCRPKDVKPDYIPRTFVEAEYLINLANLKAHPGSGVTLCAKNHYGSLVRWPAEKGYYDMHQNAFAGGSGLYRPLVDLMGHAHLGGKTVLHLLDGLYGGIHYVEREPRKFKSVPFNDDWSSSLFASQDPVAIDSVGLDFLQAEWDSYPHRPGTEDYLIEAALADAPPSQTVYAPDDYSRLDRLGSLGVYERWNNPKEKKYSRNLGKNAGIELLAITTKSTAPAGIIAPGAKVMQLADGFEFTEGPAVDAEGNVFFTDQPNNRIHKWSIDGKLLTFLSDAGRSNGLYFGRDGNLYACADLNNELWQIDPQGNVTILVRDYKGNKLNGPNDLWMDGKGGIYFTDPLYKRPYWDRGPMEQDGQHVYYLSPDRKTLTRVAEDLVQPNGIIGTPDDKQLYIADIGGRRTYVYTINPDATLGRKRLFASMGSDGMTIDNEGNVYLTGKGVTVFDSRGTKIEHIPIDAGWTANVCFGGADRHTLFITAQKSLFALRMRVKGVN